MLPDELLMVCTRSNFHDSAVLCIISYAYQCVDSGNKQTWMKNICCLHWYVEHIPVASQLVTLLTASPISQQETT